MEIENGQMNKREYTSLPIVLAQYVGDLAM